MDFSTFYMRFAAALLLAAGLSSAGRAQTTRPPGPFFQPVYHTAVEKGSRQLSAPFAGGLSAPQFAQADFDKDGLLDLLIFDPSSPRMAVRTFLNKGTAGTPKYVYTPRFATYFINVAGATRYPEQETDVYSFIKLLDYNCDGIPDLFTGGYPGINVSKGAYNSRNELYFTYYKQLWYPTGGGNSLNVYVAGSDIPGIADVDGDGDIDFVSYATAGSRMEYCRNYRVERNLSCDSIQLELETSCWSRVRQGIDRTLITNLDTNCVPASPFWEPGTGGLFGQPTFNEALQSAKTTAHGSNTLCLLDYEGDGDMDILNSNESFNDIQLQLNSKAGRGPGAIDSIVLQDTLWQTGGKPLALRSFPAAFYTDYDADGKRDVLVAPHFESPSSKDYNQVWWYRNVGTAGAPQFVFQKDSLLSEDMIDGGSNSHPLFYDFNKDGRPDILMGSTSMEASGIRRNRLAYYQNTTTTAGSPKYKFVTDNLVNVSGLSQMGPVPAVGDLDGDGKDDLLIGLENGQMAFYKNTAASNTVPPVWELDQPVFKNADGSPVRVTGYAAPFVYDINIDGRPDILCGSNNGRLTAFLNSTAVQGIPNFPAKIDSVGKVLIDSIYGTRISTPFVGRLDSTQELYLLMGGNSGTLQAWKMADSTALTVPYTRADGGLPLLKSPGRSAPAVADMDGDGRLELLLGSKWGGLHLYWSGPPPAGISNTITTAPESPVSLFPNPATEKLTVRRQGKNSAKETLRLTLRNLMGQTLQVAGLPAGSAETTLEVAGLPAGTYLISVQSGSGIWTSKVQIVR